MVLVSALLLIGSSNQYALPSTRTASEVALQPAGIVLAKAKSESSEKSDVASDEENTDSDDLKSSPSSNSSQSKSESQNGNPNKPRQFKHQLVDTSIEEAPATKSAPSASERKSPAYVEREEKLSAPLKTLIQAPQIYDSSKGGASELANAFAAASKDGAKSREDLLFIVENGSPAGKIYAAVLIKNFDVPMGNKILNGFKNEKTLVNNKSYTSLEHFTMGEVVTDLLSPAPTIILKPR